MSDPSLMHNKSCKSSQANHTLCKSTSIAITWNIDFNDNRLSGSVKHYVEVLSDCTSVDFDTSKLTITNITINDLPTSFELGEPLNSLGQKLSVSIPETLRVTGAKFVVNIEYSAHPDASAIQWLDSSATKGKKYPYVFTQCQAIHARSLLPCQDSPGVKAPYSAVVHCPEWCTVLMSALAVKELSKPGEFHWNQPVPTSAYLICLAAGNLASRDIRF